MEKDAPTNVAHVDDMTRVSTHAEDSDDLEKVHTFERVGTHAQYYEKNGLRTEGDGLDHSGANFKMTAKLFMSLVAMAFLWVGSQIPLYLFGGVIADIYSDIGGVDRWVWFAIGYLIPNAALCPFVGALSDLFGRKYLAIGGQICLIVGPIVTSTANTMNVAIGGQVISGVGAGLNELIALAGTGELVPTSKRSQYVGIIVMTIIPFAPSVVYAQLITAASSWRYVGVLVAVWNFIGLVLVAVAYSPPPRINMSGYSRKEILKRIDYIGGLLSIGGVLCFMMGLQWSAQQYTWQSAHVLAPLILGIILIIAFFIYEIWIARYPMVPHRMFHKAKLNMAIILLITFLSGANFFVVLLMWPTEIYNVYGNDPVGIGLRSLPVGFGILAGAVVCLVLIPITGGRIKLLMIVFTAMMTAGTGAMAYARPDNMGTMWGIVFLGCFAVGGVIIPCSIIAQICCPDDLIATVTAITLSVRYVGGAIGFTAYFNVFYNKIVPALTRQVAYDVVTIELGSRNLTLTTDLTTYVGNAQFGALRALYDASSLANNTMGYDMIVRAAQGAFADSYAWCYYISIAFGGVCFILSLFLTDIKSFLDDHVAVVG